MDVFVLAAGVTSVTPLQMGILIAYFAVLIGVAFAFRGLNKNSDDYFRSGCQGKWWLVGMSTYMSSFSAYTFTGLAGATYEAGFSAMSGYFANIIGFALNGLFLAAWLRQLRATTVPEVIRDRFGSVTEQVYSWVGNLFGIIYAAITLQTLSTFVSAVFSFHLNATIIFIGLAVLIYSMVGGRWAVMGNDFVQSLILIPITVLIAVLCLQQVGGFSGLWVEIGNQGLWEDFKLFKEPQERYHYNYTAPWVFATIISLMMDRLSLTAAPRYFSVRDGKEASMAAWMVCGLMVLSTLIFFIPPLVVRLKFEGAVEAMGVLGVGKPAETAFAVAAMQMLPEGLLGLMVIAIFAATTSTMDTGLNLFAAVFTRNIYPAWCRWKNVKPMEGEKLMHLGEILTLFSGLVIICIALYFANQEGKGAFEIMLDFGALLGTPMAVPMVMSLFTRKAPAHAAGWSIGISFLVAAAGRVSDWTYDERVFLTIAAGLVGYFLAYQGSIDTEEVKARIREFYLRMHRKVDFDAEVGNQGGESAQARILGVVALLMGAGVAALVYFDQEWTLNGRWGILGIAMVSLLTGAGLLYYSRRAK